MSNRPARPCARVRSDEMRGAQRARREVLPRRRLVRELDPLARAREDHRVLADDVAAAQACEADRAALALAGHAFARVDGALRQRGPAPRAAASPRPSAVPDGASTLCR